MKCPREKRQRKLISRTSLKVITSESFDLILERRVVLSPGISENNSGWSEEKKRNLLRQVESWYKAPLKDPEAKDSHYSDVKQSLTHGLPQYWKAYGFESGNLLLRPAFGV